MLVHGCVHQHAYAVHQSAHTVSTNTVYAAISARIDPHMYMLVCLLMLCACADLHVCMNSLWFFNLESSLM